MAYKLLLVEDELDIVSCFKEYFEIKKFTVSTCPTGEEALTLLENEKPDIAVLDLLLAGKLDGLGVLREANKLSPSTKVIMLTGSDTIETEKEARKIGISRYLHKPVGIKELHSVITEVLAEK
jgi:DNA-binding response OmpR family regulator